LNVKSRFLEIKKLEETLGRLSGYQMTLEANPLSDIDHDDEMCDDVEIFNMVDNIKNEILTVEKIKKKIRKRLEQLNENESICN